MSELLESANPAGESARPHVPTIYFIDDSATMREVIKIAFRRENINVVTCPDASTALAQFEQTPPDAVITDVIMPDKDGYEVCQHIKEHPQYGQTPVILMSGVVNKSVAEKAISVRADELIRKPFQPQELVSRVRSLLQPKTTESAEADEQRQPAKPFSSIFAPPAAAPALPPSVNPPSQPEYAWPRALAQALAPQPAAQPPMPRRPAAPAPAPTRPDGAHAAELQKLRNEIMHLELLVKKLQTELSIEKQYCASLELHIRTLQEPR
jgi:CheY-like chemotaxis protein